MSTERPDNDVTGPRRRRPPFVVASVAAAVLLAGGGGAYWASTASGGEGAADTGPAASGDRVPPVLTLDGPGSPAGTSANASSPPPGIAPGEPDPHGDGVLYRADGKLPDGPDSAAVYRAKGTVTSAEVARLAKALGVAGTPRTDGASWKVGTEGDGSGPLLRVNKQAPGSWTFARYASGGPDGCVSTTVCEKNGTIAPGDGPAVSEKAAKAAAAPVLKAVGQDDAALDARQLMGTVRVVNADPVVGGLLTYGWSTGIQVGSDGEVVGGSGHLKGLEKGAGYPLIGADEALNELNRAGRHNAKADIGGCATPVPLQDGVTRPPGTTPGTAPVDPREGDCTPPGGETARSATMTVEKAVLGLAPQYVDGEQALLPSWLFSVRPADAGPDVPDSTVARIAVEPRYLARESARPTPAPTKTPGTDPGDSATSERRVTSYSADGRTLDVTFWGGVCSTYTASAAESGGTVRITVTESKPDAKKVCIMIAKELTRTVTLDAPLDGRKVVDAATGETVPRA